MRTVDLLVSTLVQIAQSYSRHSRESGLWRGMFDEKSGSGLLKFAAPIFSKIRRRSLTLTSSLCCRKQDSDWKSLKFVTNMSFAGKYKYQHRHKNTDNYEEFLRLMCKYGNVTENILIISMYLTEAIFSLKLFPGWDESWTLSCVPTSSLLQTQPEEHFDFAQTTALRREPGQAK